MLNINDRVISYCMKYAIELFDRKKQLVEELL